MLGRFEPVKAPGGVPRPVDADRRRVLPLVLASAGCVVSNPIKSSTDIVSLLCQTLIGRSLVIICQLIVVYSPFFSHNGSSLHLLRL